MSAISELLSECKEKTNANYRISFEDGGVYRGYNYLITLNLILGFRCGYVSIPKGHPLYDQKERVDEIEMHGGCTYFDNPIYVEDSDEEKWIGFDCAHFGDGYDKKIVKKYNPYFYTYFTKLKENNVVRTKEYVEQECKNIIDQIIKIYVENKSCKLKKN